MKTGKWKPSSDPTVLYSERIKAYWMPLKWMTLAERTFEIKPQKKRQIGERYVAVTHISVFEPCLSCF